MLFITIRLVFWSLVFIACFLLIRKSNILHKRRWILTVFTTAVVLSVMSFIIPIENVFVTFSSPESAYGYTNSGEVKLIVEGEQSDFVVGEKDSANVYAIIPKVSNGWKLGMGLDVKRIRQTISEEIIIYVYQYKDSDDYYITVFNANGGTLKITDSDNSEFCYLSDFNATLNKTFYTYYAYVNNFDSKYTITVNGRTIALLD